MYIIDLIFLDKNVGTLVFLPIIKLEDKTSW